MCWWEVGVGNGGRTAGSWSHLPSGSRELVFWARVLWTLAHETVVPTFRLGLSTSVHFFLETPSLTRSEVCFPGDFRSSQVDDEEESSQCSLSRLFIANRAGDPSLTHWLQSPSSRLKTRVGGSHNDPALNFLRDFHTIFQNGSAFTFPRS